VTDFFRFPHTPHLAWLGEGIPRDDKVLSRADVKSLLAGVVIVEEKLDGANLGLSLDANGKLQAQNRGQYLADPHAGQFTRLPAWLSQHGDALHAVLTPSLVLFGEWCAARHSLDYAALPDWLLLFDVYDKSVGRFWSSSRRNKLANEVGLVTVPQVFHGKTSLSELKRLVVTTSSNYRSGPLEGLVIRRESLDWCDVRAKLVRPDFTQAIDTHWRKRSIEWNRIDYSPETVE
jgi:ATP-dependent RNA circularization protein (DNA/RNA ligase family)